MKIKNNFNVHLYPSSGKHETRIFKSMDAAKNTGMFDKVIFFSQGDEQSPKRIISFNVTRSSSNFWYIAASTIHLFKLRPRVINVHNWYSLLPAIIFKILFHSKIIYEPHEVEFGTSYAEGTRSTFINILESVSLKLFINEVIFVGQAVKNEYIRAYGNNNKVLSSMIYFSIPSKVSTQKNYDNVNKISYLGLFVDGRNISSILESAKIRNDLIFEFIGHGPLKNKLNETAVKYDNINVVNSMNEEKLSIYLKSNIQIGLCLMNTHSLSNRCAAPNKFFTFVSNNIPVIVSPFGDQALLTHKYNLGKILDEVSPRSLIDAIDEIKSNEGGFGFEDFKRNFSFSKQNKELEDLYKRI